MTDESVLLYLCHNAVSIFNDMKKDKTNILKGTFGHCSTAYEVLDVILENFYSTFFSESTRPNIGYMVFYFMFQSFYFSDPENFFMYDEDFFQTLMLNTFVSFDKFLKRYYSIKNMSKLSTVIDVNVFCVRNFSRVMNLEFQNIKRVMQTEVKKPCSFYSSVSDSFEDCFKDDHYELSDMPRITLSNVKTIYE